jgi:hypothetical protein
LQNSNNTIVPLRRHDKKAFLSGRASRLIQFLYHDNSQSQCKKLLRLFLPGLPVSFLVLDFFLFVILDFTGSVSFTSSI